MSDRPDPADRSTLDVLRDELGDQFGVTSDGQQRTARRGLRPGLVAVIALIAFVPGAVALAGGFDGAAKTHTIEVSGSRVMVDGKLIDCPASFVLLKKLGKDPCNPDLVPHLRSVAPNTVQNRHLVARPPPRVIFRAPPPALSPASSCPEWVREFLRSALYGEAKFSDYDDLPGYPFKGCPTAHQLAPSFSLDARDKQRRATRPR